MNGRGNALSFLKLRLVYKMKWMFYENKIICFMKNRDNLKYKIGSLTK